MRAIWHPRGAEPGRRGGPPPILGLGALLGAARGPSPPASVSLGATGVSGAGTEHALGGQPWEGSGFSARGARGEQCPQTRGPPTPSVYVTACTYGCECMCEQGEAGNQEGRRPLSAGQGPGGGGQRLGPSSHVKQLCAGAAVPRPPPLAAEEGAGGGPEGTAPPWLFPALRAAHACWGTTWPCSASWARGQLSVPLGQSSVPPWGMGTAQCPHQAQLCAPFGRRGGSVSHGDGSVSPVGWGQLEWL